MANHRTISLLGVIGAGIAAMVAPLYAQPFAWRTVVNNDVLVPACGATDGSRKFNSYGQPSVNEYGLVVFRGRSKGEDSGGGDAAVDVGASGPPARGVYVRGMRLGIPVAAVACVSGAVPQPNNLGASFNEFPAFPRIDATSSAIATRGQSLPVWEYPIGPDAMGATRTTRVGTSGIYTNPGGVLATGASLLGAVVEYPSTALAFPQYAVPAAPAGTRFDQFPGSPTVAAGTNIGFKGNFTVDGVGRTGVFFRDAGAQSNPTYHVASSFTRIPNQPRTTDFTFGSTAPPTAADDYLYFVGSDNEDAPALGGIYRARTKDKESLKLETLVGIGTQVPGEPPGTGFALIGEGLSVSAAGEFVAFWGAWGTGTFARTLFCPVDGNADLIAYCLERYPEGFAVAIPSRQGVIVYDVKKKEVRVVAKTGQDGLEDFLYWVYSGAPPGTGGGGEGIVAAVEEEAREAPRWRSSAFVAVTSTARKVFTAAFKATQGDGVGGTTDGVPGIFLRNGTSALVTVAKQGLVGSMLDSTLPPNAEFVSVGIERDGFRGRNLAMTASGVYYDSAGAVQGWAGIYITQVPLAD